MVEIALGIVLVLGAVGILAGAAPMLGLPDVFTIVGFSGASVVAGLGVLLILHGTYRRARRAGSGDQTALRTIGLTSAALAAVALFALGIPLLVEPLNLVTIGGFPLGFYLVAQGVLIGLVILVFVYARAMAALDSDGD